jgi:osmotically-inducible protein OsmY
MWIESGGGTMRSDDDIKKDVESELWWDPKVDTTYLVVVVHDGVVNLTGAVRTHDEQSRVEAAAKRVPGVLRVVSNLKFMDERLDPDIERDVVMEIRKKLPAAADHIAVKVRDGWVSLDGEVERNVQRVIAEDVIRWVKGVKGVTNNIHLKS